MSNGGGREENGTRDNDETTTTTTTTRSTIKHGGGDDYGRAIARIAVAQICQTTGFHSLQESALDTLSDIVIRYLRDLGKTSHFYANLAGRMDCNLFDIILGLEDLGSSVGFSSASETNQCIAGSGVVREISRYVNNAEEVPFAQTVPCFPIARNRRPTPSFVQIGESPAGKHIPDWLPAFPDPHTYVHTPVWNERTSDPRADKLEQARQRRKAERSLLNLHQRLACSGSEACVPRVPRATGKTNHVSEGNPSMAIPLQSREKPVSTLDSPSKLQNETETPMSVLETFAPVIEAAKSGFHGSEDSKGRALPNKRPVLHFKFGAGKKFLGMPIDLQLQNKGVGSKTGPWLGRDDEKDDKKRRAEQILKESVGNNQELAQL